MSKATAIKTALLCVSLFALTACATSPSYSPAQQDPGTVKRSFVDGLYGQVHVRVSTPTKASAKTPLLLLHPTPYSSQVYLPFIKDIGKDRIVIAMDTPGYGDSDRPKSPPSLEDYARNATVVLDQLGITEPVDALGYHTGTLIAVEMALNSPERINKLVLAGTPVYPSERLQDLYAKYAKPEVLSKNGSHLTSKWKFVTLPMAAGMSLEAAQLNFSDYMQALPKSTQAYYSVFSYPGYERLPLITKPSLFVSINGSLKQETMDAQKITPGSELVYLDSITTGLFDVAYPEMADITRKYLN